VADVEVRFGERRWTLSPGRELTFGRDPGCDIRLGTEPDDRLVSRRAGVLYLSDGRVHVRNDSATREIYLVPIPGRELAVRPGMAAGLPDRPVHLVLLGRHGARYEVVMRSGPAPAPDVKLPTTSSRGRPTVARAGALAPREERMLVALCEPMLTLAGEDARPATYAAIGKRLHVGAEYVRRCLGELRERLANEDGMPRLRGDHAGDGSDYREALATWALDSGTVTSASLALLADAP